MPPVLSSEPGLWKVLRNRVIDQKNINQSWECLWVVKTMRADYCCQCCLLLSDVLQKRPQWLFTAALEKRPAVQKTLYSFFDRIYLFGMLCDSFLPITCTFKKLVAPFPFEVLSNHVVSDTKAYRAVPTALWLGLLFSVLFWLVMVAI